MGSVWLIEERYWRDNYSGGDWEDVPDTDLGYFASETAAQAYCDERNGYMRKAYDEYVAKIEKQAAEYKRMYANALKRYQALVDAGFTDERKPKEPVTEKVKTFEEYRASRTYEWTSYSPLEIEPFAGKGS